MQKLLSTRPSAKIRITEGADDLCKNCPNRCGGDCRSSRPTLFDQNVLTQTGFSYGQVLSWEEITAKTDELRRYHLERTCPDCEWMEVCKGVAGGGGI